MSSVYHYEEIAQINIFQVKCSCTTNNFFKHNEMLNNLKCMLIPIHLM